MGGTGERTLGGHIGVIDGGVDLAEVHLAHEAIHLDKSREAMLI